MLRRFLLPASMLSLLAGHYLLSGCSAASGYNSSTNDLMGSGASDCTATFTWWQKDAYLNSPGRQHPLWPPHTTTQLQVTCGGEVVGTASMTNHGTPYGTTNDAGVPMLTQTDQATVTGTQAQLTSLLSTYQACECDPATTGGPGTVFLSAQPPSAVMGQVLAAVAAYASQNLVCPASTPTAQVANMLSSGNFDGAVTAMLQCSWSNGSSFEAGLNQAASALSGELSSTLAGYHVCNNDAMLQANLFASFQQNGSVAACDKTASVCSGPAFFYNPASASEGGGEAGTSDGGSPASGDGAATGSGDGETSEGSDGGYESDGESTDGSSDSGFASADGGTEDAG
jgi:hypothetical protein